jgi:hypothetical protein
MRYLNPKGGTIRPLSDYPALNPKDCNLGLLDVKR